jgi:pimeloyl-ACP methyl ester carboxylesterase
VPDAFDMSAARDALGTTDTVVEAAGISFHARTWGHRTGRPVLLVHGLGASSAVWWRVGPGLAGAGFRVVAPDLPGHGRTGTWTGHQLARENARDLLAFLRAAGLDRADLAVVGHSWGGMTIAELPGLGFRPLILVLVDPPTLSQAGVRSMLEDPVEHHYEDLDEAVSAVRSGEPGWSAADVLAKAEALTQVDEAAARAILEDNDFDSGLAALADPAAAGVPTWLIRGDPTTGGLIPADVLSRFEARLGADHIVTMKGAPHSPQRTHPEAFFEILLGILVSAA